MDYAALGKTPIPGENASGADMRYDPDFEAIQSEIDKLSSPTASSQVDWRRVAENAAGILSSKSKDLTIACYLSAALICTRQIDGLDLGLQLLGDMVENYWDTLYPPKKRMRGRAAAVQWWMERAQAELQKLNPAPLSNEQAERMRTNLKRFDTSLAANMPEAPILRTLQRQIESLPVQKGEAPVESQAPSDSGAAPRDAGRPPAPVPEKGPAEAALSGDIANDTEARRAADAAFQRLRQISLFLIQADLKNPLAYRYRRIAGWAKLTALPVHTDGTTQLVPPAPQVISALEALRAEGNLQAFIQSAEQKFSQFIFWFDVNRQVAEALNDLGADYQKASSAVCQETAALLQRLPGLTGLRFSNGTPFADPQTQQWLQSIRACGEPGAAGAGPSADSQPDGASDAVLQKARALARKKNLVEAVGMLQQEMLHSSSQLGKMHWRFAIARLLLEAKKPQQAQPHLEQILADIDAYRLDSWDPDLAVEGWTLAWQGFSSQNLNELKARAAELIVRVARIDPVAALRLAS